jgi:bla regulator protein BlaR1
MKNSVVWYSQQISSRLGEERVQRYVQSFNYGNQDVSGDPGENKGSARPWISSSLKISPVEQVAFLRRVVNRQLPLTANAYDMTFRIMKLETLANGWEIYGKTGTASPLLPDGKVDHAHAYGWFVGWASKGKRTVVFARLVLEPQQKTSFAGPRVKEAMLRDLPSQLELL